jgi:hypothetical protein
MIIKRGARNEHGFGVWPLLEREEFLMPVWIVKAVLSQLADKNITSCRRRFGSWNHCVCVWGGGQYFKRLERQLKYRLGVWRDDDTSFGSLERWWHIIWESDEMMTHHLGVWRDDDTSFGSLTRWWHLIWEYGDVLARHLRIWQGIGASFGNLARCQTGAPLGGWWGEDASFRSLTRS